MADRPDPVRSQAGATMSESQDSALGIRHAHDWQVMTARPRLQSAHDTMRWDVAKSRLLSVEVCAICYEHQRDTVIECSAPNCREHAICQRPHR